MNIRKILLLALIISTAMACSDDDEDEGFGLRVSPSEDYISRTPGSIVSFTFSAQSKEPLARYRVIETINSNSQRSLKDISISGKNYSDFFDYEVPDTFGFGNHQIKILFSTFDVTGTEMQRAKFINVRVTDRPLSEYGSFTMYSSASNQFDAFDLIKGTPKYSSDTTAHIRDLSVNDTTGLLSKTWTSEAPNINFLKFNDFDYGNATSQSVKTAYDAGIKNDTIRNLDENDIILTKVDNKYMAIKLIFVTDQTGVDNDRYIFTVKR